MASDKLSTVSASRIHNGLTPHPQLVFPEGFTCGPLRLSAAADPCTKTATTRELTSSFLGHRNYFQPHPPPPHQAEGFRHQWNANSRSSGGDASDDDDDDEDEGVEDKEEEEGNSLERAVTVAKVEESNRNETYSSNSNSQKMKHISALGIREVNVGLSVNENSNENNSGGELRNARGGEMYYSHYLKYLNSAEGPSTSPGRKEMVVENECGFSGKKESSCYSETGDSLRAILSDPITGILMDDALILPCGHSFGSGGIQQVLRVKACFTCSQPVSEDSVAPNLSLRLAVQAFRREEALRADRSMKRRRERYEKGTYDPIFTDHSRGRGAQFPFAVTDRVIIKGNKRTPPRFVGREAIVTTQCLNGWYVVKTLDNAESVKLQYRSLAKIPDGPSGKR